MADDIFGQETSLTARSCAELWNKVQLGVLSHSAATPAHLGQLLDTAPHFALGQAAKGLFLMLLGRREMQAAARDALTAALGNYEAALPRERRYVDALQLWLEGRPSRAVQMLETVLRDHPADSLAMKMSQAIRFVLGDSEGMRRSIERVMPAYEPGHVGRGYLLGCHAFALEETGDYAKAETTGRQALWMAPDDAWGLHAVAHVHDMTGNAKAGLEWLSGREGAWSHCNNFRYHVWWHKALMHLDLGQTDVVLDLYDREIRNDKTDDYRDISNATSLLMRLELDGIPIGNRWEELSDLCANRTEDGSLIFADLHYLLALAGRGRKDEATQMVRRIHADAGRAGQNEARQRMADPGRAAASGLEAFGEGDFGLAFDHLSQARTSMQLAGGSHAQRDVFERMTIDSGLRAGRLCEVTAILDARRAQRGGSEDNYALARRAMIQAAQTPADIQSLPAE
jgi:tetratricopeptide (TPR) repeat protein